MNEISKKKYNAPAPTPPGSQDTESGADQISFPEV